jgi:hypothetical protein
MRLHRVVLDAGEAVRALHDHGGLVEAGGSAPALPVELVADVAARDRAQARQVGEVAGERRARVDQRRARGERLLEERAGFGEN